MVVNVEATAMIASDALATWGARQNGANRPTSNSALRMLRDVMWLSFSCRTHVNRTARPTDRGGASRLEITRLA
jgi:hypothetical protein